LTRELFDDDAGAGVRVALGTRKSKSVGKLLSRAAQCEAVNGLRVERRGKELNVVMWGVVVIT
jgi:hypothetical protein